MKKYIPQKFNADEVECIQELKGSELASFSRRAFAFIMDIIIASALFILIIGPFEKLLQTLGLMRKDYEITLVFFGNWYSIVWFILYFGLSTFIGNGKTIGKWIMQIRIVSLVHNRLSLWHSFERSLGYGASLLEFGFGFFQYFIHPNRRTVHDRIAETIVIREQKNRSRSFFFV